ncbi:MAG: AAA domain-containing protein [Planctomycetota bacterium]
MNVTLLEKLKPRLPHRRRRAWIRVWADESEGGVGIAVRSILDEVRRAVLGQRRWRVREDAALAILAFSKVTMWEDLEANAEVLLENPVVDHLVHGPGAAFESEDLPAPRDVDRELPAVDCLCPLDADSSQLAASVAQRGRTFVLQGPPGTGKSQTITNMIAQAMGQGRTVLFVAEKRAALEVVRSRLARIGLAPFCLEVHSNKASKREVLAQLETAVQSLGARAPEEWESEARRLEELRRELNRHAEAIHARHPSGLSVFRATSELIGLREVPVFPADAERVRSATAEEVDGLGELGDRLATAADRVAPIVAHPLRAVRRREFSPRLPGELRADAEALAGAARAAEAEWRDLATRLEAPAVASDRVVSRILDLLERAARSPGVSRSLLETADWKGFEADFTAVVALKSDRDERRAELAGRFRPEFLDLEPLPEIAAIDEAEAKWFLPRWFARRAVARRLGAYLARREDLDLAAYRAALEASAEIRRADRELADPRHVAPARLAENWQGGEADTATLWAQVRFAREFREALAALPGSPDGEAWRARLVALATGERERLAPGGPWRIALERAAASRHEYDAARRALVECVDLDETAAFGPEDAVSPDLVAAAAEALAGAGGALADWCHWRRVRGEAEELGWEGLLAAVDAGTLAPEGIRDALRRSFLEEWLLQAVESDDRLRRFNTAEHGRKIASFREADRHLIELAGKVAAARAAGRIPDFNRESPDASEVGLLKREMRKKRRHLPLRKLFASLPGLLPRLKPCLLMSPLSVAQYLEPSRFRADLVIFDEASQIPVWDAIGALARGKAAVVVGDSKQLPPTSFFSRADVEDEDAADVTVDEVESILDECEVSGLPTSRLLWHYRSRHESLIAFSNHHYYDNRLLTFPSAADRVEGLGVSMRYFEDGVYDRGRSATNRREAEAIVEEVVALPRARGSGAEALDRRRRLQPAAAEAHRGSPRRGAHRAPGDRGPLRRGRRARARLRQEP